MRRNNDRARSAHTTLGQHIRTMCFFILIHLLAYLPTTYKRIHIHTHKRNVTSEKRTRTWTFFRIPLSLVWFLPFVTTSNFTQTFIIPLVYHEYRKPAYLTPRTELNYILVIPMFQVVYMHFISSKPCLCLIHEHLILSI
jgi:hypothetical protein